MRYSKLPSLQKVSIAHKLLKIADLSLNTHREHKLLIGEISVGGIYDITPAMGGGYYLIDERSNLIKIDEDGQVIFTEQVSSNLDMSSTVYPTIRGGTQICRRQHCPVGNRCFKCAPTP